MQTRLQKLDNGVAEATFLAMAGLNRLKMDDVPKYAIEVDDMLPAVAQGAIGIERRISLAELDGDTLRLRGEVLRPDGSENITDDMTGTIADGPAMGADMARKMLDQAGDDFFAWRGQ